MIPSPALPCRGPSSTAAPRPLTLAGEGQGNPDRVGGCPVLCIILAAPSPTVVAMRFVLLHSLGKRVRPRAGFYGRSISCAPPRDRMPTRRRASISPTLFRKRGAVSRRLLRLSILPHYLPRSTAAPRRRLSCTLWERSGSLWRFCCRAISRRLPRDQILRRHAAPPSLPPSPGKAGSGSLWGFSSRSLPLPFRDPPHAR